VRDLLTLRLKVGDFVPTTDVINVHIKIKKNVKNVKNVEKIKKFVNV